MNTLKKRCIQINMILFGIFAFTLMCPFTAYATNTTNSNETVDYLENITGINFNYTMNNIYNKNNSQLVHNETNFTTKISITDERANVNIPTIKIEMLNQLIQSIIFLFTIIITIGIAIHQVLEPKYHQLLKSLLFNKKHLLLLALTMGIYFIVLCINFFIEYYDPWLKIEFAVLFIPILYLLYLLYKLINYSNKSILIDSYLTSLSELDVFSEVCNKIGYPKEEDISAPHLRLKYALFTNNKTIDFPTFESEIKLDNEKIRELNLKIKNNNQEADIESVFEIIEFSIDKSEYYFLSKHMDTIYDIFYQILMDKTLNNTIKENITSFLIDNYSNLVKLSIHKEDFQYYTIVIRYYERLGKLLIDINYLNGVRKIVENVGKHSLDLNEKIFHINYSYKGNDCIFSLINYYIDIDTNTYDDEEVEKWLQMIGAVAEDIVTVDYQIKYRSIRNDSLHQTKLSYNPVDKIIKDLTLLNDKIIQNINLKNNDSVNGERVIEITSSILKNITIKLLEIDDFSTTYNVYAAYEKITQNSINKEIHYSLNYILHDLHKIGHEILTKEWYNNANAFLFDIAKLGVSASNKDLINPYTSNKEWFHVFAEILKYLYEMFIDIFGEEPHQKYPDDFFTELKITSDSEKFEDYYKLCKPDTIIIEDIKEEP